MSELWGSLVPQCRRVPEPTWEWPRSNVLQGQSFSPLTQHEQAGSGAERGSHERLDFLGLQILRERGTFGSGKLLHLRPARVYSPGPAREWGAGGRRHLTQQ